MITRAMERLLLALFVLAMFAGAVIVLSFLIVPEQNRDAVLQLIGGVNSLAGMVIGFYFGANARHDDQAAPRREQPPAGPDA